MQKVTLSVVQCPKELKSLLSRVLAVARVEVLPMLADLVQVDNLKAVKAVSLQRTHACLFCIETSCGHSP